MDVTVVVVLLPFMIHVAQSSECNHDFIFSTAGWNVSLEWIFVNKSSIGYRTASFVIFHLSENRIADMRGQECNVYDHISTFCNISDRNNEMIAYLTILNVTTRHSGTYTLRLTLGLDEKGNSSKKLVVIGKPKIKEIGKPILSQRFEMTCDSSHELECLIYKWRINGTQTTHLCNGSKHSISSLHMTDNFSHFTCRVCLNEIASNFSEPDSCSEDSDPYTVQVLYGPDNISLSLKKINFYLKDRQFFTIDCYANCNPNCTFLWKGHKTTYNKKLEITSFESQMAGYYTCHVTNQATNHSLKSNTISLHHVKDDNYNEENKGAVRPEEQWIAPAIISVFLLIIGVVILLTNRRKCTTRAIDSLELSRISEQQTDIEVIRKELERLNRLLHIPSIQDRVTRRTKGQKCPNDSQQNNCEPNVKEDPYSTIDDNALTADFDDRIEKVINENSHETGRSIAHVFYDYARSIEMCRVETADVHASDEPYLTPNKDFERSFEILHDEELDVIEKDHAYLALMDDQSLPIENCHVEETDTNVTDETYLTPINEL